MSLHSVFFREGPMTFRLLHEAEFDTDMPQDKIIQSCDDACRELLANKAEFADGVGYFVDNELMYFVHTAYFKEH